MTNPRTRHVAIAMIVAALVAMLTLMRPLDITLWSLQSKLFWHEPSGEIVIITDETGASSKSVTSSNRLIVEALEQLDSAGATRIAIDTPLRNSGVPDLDTKLNDALVRLGNRVILAAPVDQGIEETALRAPNADRFANSAPLVSSDLLTDFLGFVWQIEPEYASSAG
ncbi:MAG: hypothetical protein AAFR64_12505 [Pseudomonadota bacterium]